MSKKLCSDSHISLCYRVPWFSEYGCHPREQGREQAEEDGLCRREPELELGQAPDEWPKLLLFAVAAATSVAWFRRVCRGQARCSLLDVLLCQVLLERRVKLGLQEGEEEV